MAAYASTTTVDQRTHDSITPAGSAIVTGTIDVTNYNSTHVADTAVSSRFRSLKRVILNSVSDNGFLGVYVAATNSVKCYYADYDGSADGALIQAANDVDCGSFNFIAYGVI